MHPERLGALYFGTLIQQRIPLAFVRQGDQAAAHRYQQARGLQVRGGEHAHAWDVLPELGARPRDDDQRVVEAELKEGALGDLRRQRAHHRLAVGQQGL